MPNSPCSEPICAKKTACNRKSPTPRRVFHARRSNSVEDLVGLFEGVRFDAVEGLFAVHGQPSERATEPSFRPVSGIFRQPWNRFSL